MDDVDILWRCSVSTTLPHIGLCALKHFPCLCSPMTLLLALQAVMHAVSNFRFSDQHIQPYELSSCASGF